MSHKKTLFLFFFVLPLFFTFPQQADDLSHDQLIRGPFMISSLFCDSRGDHYHTGIDLAAIDAVIQSPDDCETIFFNLKRHNSIFYGNGNFIVLESIQHKQRYSFSHLKDGSIDHKKRQYAKGEKIAITGNSGHSTGSHLHYEIEDRKKNVLLNPIHFLDIKDTIKPVIEDIYFITHNNQKVSLIKNNRITRGGKLFVKCYDRIDDSNFRLMPYEIKVIIDGKDHYQLTFDYLKKKEHGFTLSDTNKKFKDLYVINEQFNYYLTEYFGLPGVISIKIIVKDYAGNSTSFLKPIRILLPQ